MKQFLNFFPKTKEQFEEKILDTEQLWQFPCCWGAVDGCHLSINCPPGGQEAQKEYHNFKNFYSVVLMAIVDAKCRFIWANVGCPGNSHDYHSPIKPNLAGDYIRQCCP